MPDGLRSPCAALTNEKLAGGRVLVTGAAGMLGSQLLLDAPGSCMAVGTDLGSALDGSPEVEFVGVDLTDESAVVDLFRSRALYRRDPRRCLYGCGQKPKRKANLREP